MWRCRGSGTAPLLLSHPFMFLRFSRFSSVLLAACLVQGWKICIQAFGHCLNNNGFPLLYIV